MEGFQATGEAQLPEENIPLIKTLNFLIFFSWVICVFLDPHTDPNPDLKSLLTGSHPVPDAKHWSGLRFFVAISRTTKYGPVDHQERLSSDN
jgi:hypothetical protein